MDIRLDEGFLFGMGAFETIAVEKGKPILLEKHIERLEKAADFLQLGSCSARGFSKEKVFSYLASQDSEMTDHGVLKIVCSAENMFFQMRKNIYSEEDYAKGFVTDISKVRRNETSPLVYHKTLNYGDCILEKRAATAAGINEKVFVNTKGQISEGTVSNIFFVRNGKLYTPDLSCGLLPGILREYLCETENVEEAVIYPAELRQYEECFVTNSLMGIMPVNQLGEWKSESREVTNQLLKKYESI